MDGGEPKPVSSFSSFQGIESSTRTRPRLYIRYKKNTVTFVWTRNLKWIKLNFNVSSIKPLEEIKKENWKEREEEKKTRFFPVYLLWKSSDTHRLISYPQLSIS